jgi:hypothetical protein
VQDAIETILNAIGVPFTRDKETAVLAEKGWRPDFVLTELDCALEVKYVRGKMTVAQLHEQIAADITGYKTRWKRLIVIIYDAGVIDDPHRVETEHMLKFGVTVRIVKH